MASHNDYGMTSNPSLEDLDALPQAPGYQQQRLTLQYIHSLCDIPQPSEQLEWVGRPGRDCFRRQMDALAFNNHSPPPPPSDQLCDVPDNVSTSMNSQPPHPTQLSLPVAPKKTGCSCKKTGCLKMYCECFSSGLPCGPECGCLNCQNNVENEEVIQRSREVAKHRFRQAYYNPLDGGVKKRCHCKKTQCQKKYCECFNMGVKCNELCRCEGCENGGCGEHKGAEKGETAVRELKVDDGLIC